VSPNGQLHFTPREEDVRMMSFFFGNAADAIAEGESLLEIPEGIFLFEMMLSDHFPIGAQLLLQIFESQLQGLHFPAVGPAFIALAKSLGGQRC
jgi:hypothetical protein